MCGIAGYLYFDRERRGDARLLARMTDRIRHRGPDDTGLFVSENVALGACRLSIIDLAGGHQPLSNEDDTCWVAYNGEIYNFLEVREALIGRGHAFRTKCDTEVIVHAYEEYGLDFVRRLEGMFGFALWDGRTRRLVLGRDRIGIKPLYYARVDGSLVFGSEIKSILEYPGFERKVDLPAFDNLLTFEYNPSAQTVFAGVRKLPAGHLLVANDSGELRLERYWDLEPRDPEIRDLAEAVERLRAELGRAVKSHLMSDVPLGVFLSGGMDSSTIVALMSRSESGPVKTFSIGFKDGKDYDELAFARAVAEHCHTEHHEFVLEPRAIEIVPDLVWHLEEPIADEAALPLYFLSRAARDHVKVVLAGDGGDELFAGYDRYHLYGVVGRYATLPRMLREGLVEPLIRATPRLDGNGPVARLVRRSKRLLEVAYEPEERRFSAWNLVFTEAHKAQVYSGDLLRAMPAANPFEEHDRHFSGSGFSDPISRSQHVDLKTYLVDCLLMKTDKVTSAFSLECRVPLLDGRLVEYVASLPATYKYRNGRSKHILREALRGLLPPGIVDRRKQGFILPMGRWLESDLMQFAREVLLDRRTLQRGYFDRRGLTALLDGVTAADDRHARRLYALLLFETWNRVFIDGTVPAPSPRSGVVA
jgi:asparagine synthase (glutamine-hydrolysing)